MAGGRGRKDGMKRKFEALVVEEDNADGPSFNALVRKRRHLGKRPRKPSGGVAAGDSESSEEGMSSRSVGSSDSSPSSGGEAQASHPQTGLSLAVRQKLVRASANTTQPIFTPDEVHEICLHSMSEREARLQEEYANILNDRLAEQFQTFTQVNRDFLFRAYREPQNTYVS
mmetsp:Transcript_3049/g.14385  ORF Transcript_3049/g.14385 Transcript_3049/m.14385 type:complete len:171 (+) Transcript_3049:189-701(+)